MSISIENLIAITTVKTCPECELEHAAVRTCEETAAYQGKVISLCGLARELGVPCGCEVCPDSL